MRLPILPYGEEGIRRGPPLLSDRRNILVIVDEAHRSHYDSLDGYARHLRDALPYATLIAFTGTPLTKADANTREVFGAGKDYIDVYDLKRAVDDGATVRVYHEPRLIPVSLPRRLLAKFDYPPEEERAAIDLVIKQMETFANEWAPQAP